LVHVSVEDNRMPELETWLCPVHESLDKNGALEPLDNCVACLRSERDELRQTSDRLAAALKAAYKIPRPWMDGRISWPEWDVVMGQIEAALGQYKRVRNE
jgi:hypothetical protein